MVRPVEQLNHVERRNYGVLRWRSREAHGKNLITWKDPRIVVGFSL